MGLLSDIYNAKISIPGTSRALSLSSIPGNLVRTLPASIAVGSLGFLALASAEEQAENPNLTACCRYWASVGLCQMSQGIGMQVYSDGNGGFTRDFTRHGIDDSDSPVCQQAQANRAMVWSTGNADYCDSVKAQCEADAGVPLAYSPP
jgi:hypothetical protein